ncbi:hypothetical protein NL676_023382 [Syzygium grande]|nr:hypothetical protein NL676_023382 [Syzygium grande]
MFVVSVNMSVSYGSKHVADGHGIEPSIAVNAPKASTSGHPNKLYASELSPVSLRVAGSRIPEDRLLYGPGACILVDQVRRDQENVMRMHEPGDDGPGCTES